MSFTIYSKNGCPYCERIQTVLQRANLTHVVYKLDEDFTREEFYNEFGGASTFPQVIADGKQIGGCIQTIKYLKENAMI